MSDDTTAEAPESEVRSRGQRVLRRVLAGVGVVTAVLMLLGALLYFFGGMWPRTPEMRAAYSDLVEAGEAAPIEARFVIPIPGCVCHSDDPVLQAEHSVRRIIDCGGCHSR